MKRWGDVAGLSIVWLCVSAATVFAQALEFTAVRAEVDFSKQVRPWDGFGVNYVEVAQSLDYAQDPQEYGGFSLLSYDLSGGITEDIEYQRASVKISEALFGGDLVYNRASCVRVFPPRGGVAHEMFVGNQNGACASESCCARGERDVPSGG